MILATLMSLMTILMMTTLIRSMIIISRKKSVKKVILSKWILLIWIKEEGGDDVVIPAYSLQKSHVCYNVTKKSKIYFRKKDWRI